MDKQNSKPILKYFIKHLNKIYKAVVNDKINNDVLEKINSTITDYYQKYNIDISSIKDLEDSDNEEESEEEKEESKEEKEESEEKEEDSEEKEEESEDEESEEKEIDELYDNFVKSDKTSPNLENFISNSYIY